MTKDRSLDPLILRRNHVIGKPARNSSPLKELCPPKSARGLDLALPFPQKAPQRILSNGQVSSHGLQMRYRWIAKCRQVHSLQRADETAAAQAANYPFCTIEPNTGEVAVPDARMKILADIAGSKEIIPTRISFVDIAGLVRGASKGEGLGNQFLANIREVDAVVHVLRCFEDDDITHVEGRINPVADAETIETEPDALRSRKP